MANGGNYYESRWFNGWAYDNRELYDFVLPEETQKITG